jgi:hypothetical protein
MLRVEDIEMWVKNGQFLQFCFILLNTRNCLIFEDGKYHFMALGDLLKILEHFSID